MPFPVKVLLAASLHCDRPFSELLPPRLIPAVAKKVALGACGVYLTCTSVVGQSTLRHAQRDNKRTVAKVSVWAPGAKGKFRCQPEPQACGVLAQRRATPEPRDLLRLAATSPRVRVEAQEAGLVDLC